MKVLVIDDEPIFRAGLKSVLADEPDMAVVAECDTARGAFGLVDELAPDVVLLDVMLPGMDGFAAAREILRRRPETKIIMLSSRRSTRAVVEGFQAGASGYAVKVDPPAALVDAIRKVMAGERYIAPSLEPSVRRLEEAPGEFTDVLGVVSEREREVFHLLVRGRSNDEIAKELCISPKTVDTHRHHVYEKLRLHSMPDLLRFAARNGLLDGLPDLGLPPSESQGGTQVA